MLPLLNVVAAVVAACVEGEDQEEQERERERQLEQRNSRSCLTGSACSAPLGRRK